MNEIEIQEQLNSVFDLEQMDYVNNLINENNFNKLRLLIGAEIDYNDFMINKHGGMIANPGRLNKIRILNRLEDYFINKIEETNDRERVQRVT